MGLYNRTKQLLSTSASTDEEQAGSVYALVPSGPGSYDFRVFVDLSMSGGTGTPSVKVHVETSHDGEGWIPVIAPVGLEEEGELHEFIEVSALGPLIRARTELSGTLAPHHPVAVELAATAGFALVFKSQSSSEEDVVAGEAVTRVGNA